MGKSKRTIDDVDTYESDGGFISNDDGAVKKSKKAKTSSQGKSSGPNSFWSLSTGRTPRRVEISEFKGSKLVNIREFYEKDDAYLPGKKGISLSIEQYRALLQAIPEVNADLKRAGIDVSDKDQGEEVKPRKKAKATKSKANIEATSDEEEEEEEEDDE